MLFRFYKKVVQKPNGRVFAVGDVHGCLDQLSHLLEKMCFDSARDQVVFVGDLADRGKQNRETLEFVLSKPYFHLVVGNHEELLVNYLAGKQIVPDDLAKYWLESDGSWVAKESSENMATLSKHLQQQATYIIEVETSSGTRFGVTHAGYHFPQWINPQHRYEDNYIRSLAWNRVCAETADNCLQPVSGIDYTVHGHTIFQSPKLNGNAIFIDTGCFMGGSLTALNLTEFALNPKLDDNTCIQA